MKSSGYAFAWIEWSAYWRRLLRLRLVMMLIAIGSLCLTLAERVASEPVENFPNGGPL